MSLQALRAATAALLVLAAPAAALPNARRAAPSTAFVLFDAHNLLLDANRVQCNIDDIGEFCVDPTNSPVSGGGFWPRGTHDQYLFNGGLQIAAILDGAAGVPWVGDTVGAFFFDARGSQRHGAPITRLLDSRRTPHEQWPAAARALDTSLFAAELLGSGAVSNQDTWVRYWDLSSTTSGRKHPMGILVEQRTMAWNDPVGNDDIVYEVYRLVNVTASDPAAYAGLAAAGYGPDDIAGFVQLGRIFRERVAIDWHADVPAAGYTFSQMYFGYGADQDVGAAGGNFTNGSLVFDLMAAYQSDFRAPADWTLPSEIFYAPFAAAPGFAGQAYLRTPNGAGMTMFSNTSGGAPLPDRVGVQALWRFLSLRLLPIDGSCSVPIAQAAIRRFCQAIQSPTDSRGYTATGPFTLGPGQFAVVVMAKLFAAPVAAPIAAVPPFGALAPGLPLSGTRLVAGQDTVRNLDRAMGWTAYANANADTTITADEVVTVPRSLLWKVQLARAVVANRFLMPSAPAAPDFYVLPADGHATVVWTRSPSEQTGDPYFDVAANPLTPLYDPSFRKFDVEGYRIFRGTSPSDLRLVAQFDYAGTTISDFRGLFIEPSGSSVYYYPSTYGRRCAPELGVTATCPSFPVPIVLAGLPTQVRLGERVLLSDSTVNVLRADTMVTGGGSGYPRLSDTGVPFVFVDSGLTDGVTYYYAVTAFDANSRQSGPSSMESARILKGATPRVRSSNAQPAVTLMGLYGDDTVRLDPTAGYPAIDAADGTFKGPVPPSNALAFSLMSYATEILQPGDYEAQIDSVSPGFVGGIGEAPRLYLTFRAPDTTVAVVVDNGGTASMLPGFNAGAAIDYPVDIRTALVRYDTARARRFGIPASALAGRRGEVQFTNAYVPISAMSLGTALSQGRYGIGNQPSRYLSHSRWFDEGGSESPDPTISYAPSRDHNSGKLTGVDTIWAPTVYRNPLGAGGQTRMNVNFRGFTYGLTAWYPADFVVTWQAGGAVRVRDMTHHVNLPHARGMGSGYGFVSLAAIQASGVTAADLTDGTGTASTTMLTYHSLYTVDPVCRSTWWGVPCADLSALATLAPLDFDANGTSDGTGIVIVINGEPFFMKLSALPAAGTEWHLRAIGGLGMSATCTPAFPVGNTEMTAVISDCSGYAFNPVQTLRSGLAPGLRVVLRVSEGYAVTAASGDLSRVHTVPDPYYLTNSLETQIGRPSLRFVNLPDRAVIRIYSMSGVLVAMIGHNDPSGGGEAEWDVRNRAGRLVASGVYFWHLTTADGRQRVGRFTIVTGER